VTVVDRRDHHLADAATTFFGVLGNEVIDAEPSTVERAPPRLEAVR
jgi:hypothetical protein